MRSEAEPRGSAFPGGAWERGAERLGGSPPAVRHSALRIPHSALAGAFFAAIRESQYQGDYCCVYPIKVNQQRQVVEEILDFGKPFQFGLEAGSKPELLAVLALTNGNETPIICNGFKDDEFIKMVVLARKIGKKVIPVIEKFSELETLVRYAQELGVRPIVGVRVKLAARGSGRWKYSAGFRSKFGLTLT